MKRLLEMAFTIEGMIALCFVVIVICCVWICAGDGKVVVIDGCEYIRNQGAYSHSLTHKGNCTNSIHNYNK